MKKSIRILSGLVATLALLFIFGCAAHKIEEVEYSGFLKNYEDLTPGAEDQAVMVYRNPQADLKPYTKIMLEKVRIFLSPKAVEHGVDPDELKELADYFNQALVNELKSGYQLVDQPGPGVLHIRTAITDVVPGKPVAGTTTSIIPVGIVIAGTKGVTTGTGVGVGQAAAEFEVLDSVTGQRIAAAVDRRAGGQAPFKGKLTDAKDAMEYWAKKIRERLDEARGVQ